MSRLHIHHRTSCRCTAPMKSGMHHIVLWPREGLLQTYPRLTQDAEYDVLAVGAGIIRNALQGRPSPSDGLFCFGRRALPESTI